MKWEKLTISGYIPKGAILKIEDFLWKVTRRRKRTDGSLIVYVKEYKPIVIRKK
jgi:hypothetical protein